GKELAAQAIHREYFARHDARQGKKSHPFVAVNCGAIAESLLEAELFGYEEGAFTGSRRGGRAGLFEIAHGGTLFLATGDVLPLNEKGERVWPKAQDDASFVLVDASCSAEAVARISPRTATFHKGQLVWGSVV
ncbi:sigma 54-interacting transcriptional regulator, partial [Escherichia coli]|uniref:sigma 54-interacting transcriptional regulator n=1 Tax=Escherichia coli TaxID=562 RepID=UPI003EE3A867